MAVRTKAPWQHADSMFEIGEGHHNLGKIKSREVSLAALAKKFAEPVRDNCTHAQYLKFPKDEQDRRKNHGFWLGGPSVDGRRKNVSLRYRTVVTLDLDEGTAELVALLKAGKTRLNKYCFLIHSTRKHTSAKPRLRIVIFLKEPIAIEKYHPLARIAASLVDSTMDAIDDVSFRPAQMMFWPTVSSDAEYVFWQNEGTVMDGEAILTGFGNWQDFTKLPFSERQGQKRPSDPNKKAENPLEKKGLVGAFCRAYSIEDAIATFLSDVYVPGDANSAKPRYTFTGGSTTNGAIVEDDGLFLFSHHTTDPCTDRLVNAFDMVRLHLFGDQDAKHDPFDTKPTDFPSWKAMEEFLREDEPTKRELRQERYDLAAMFDDLGEGEARADEPEPDAADVAAKFDALDDEEGAEEDYDEDVLALLGPKPKKPAGAQVPAKPKYDSAWIEQLELTDKGTIKSSLPNETMILQNDPRFTRIVELNEFKLEVVTRRPLKSRMDLVPEITIRDAVNGDIWSDFHDTAVRMVLEAPNGKNKPGYGLKVSDRDLESAVLATAMKNRFHPVRDRLEGCVRKWDGNRRLRRLFSKYLGCIDNAYHREVALKFCIAAVARIFEPGHKFDFMPILEGPQGKRKSSFIKTLALDWFGELEGDFSDQRKLVEQMQGCWIMEQAELSSMNRSEVLDQKAFMSRTNDKVRLAYARRALEFPRQTVFMGSTNDSEYLADLTGNRRYWPIVVTVLMIDTDTLAAEIDQIWGEAVHLYREMRAKHPRGELPLFLEDREAQSYALRMQESRRITTEVDGFAGIVGAWLDAPVSVAKLEGLEARFDDLERGPDAKVLRETVSLPEIWEDCLGNDRRQYKRQDALMLSKVMRLVGGWENDDRPTRTKRFGIQKLWRRVVE